MISTKEGLRLALDQLGGVYEALAALRTEYPRASASWLALMAEGWIDQAEQLRREIEAYTGIAALEESKAELWLTVEGQGIEEGTGPTSILTALLDALRKGVQTVAEFRHAGELARRPTATLKDLCDWRVVALNSESLKIGIRLPDVPSQTEERNDSLPDVRSAVREFLDVAAWAASQEAPETLDKRFPDPATRRLLLNAVKPLVPRLRGAVNNVILTGRLAPSTAPIVLNKVAAQRIRGAIDRTTTETVESHVGDLREIDLDHLSLVIRYTEDVKEIRCTFDISLLEAAREALDRRVQVTGNRQMTAGRGSPTLHVFRLEVLDDIASGARPESEPELATKD